MKKIILVLAFAYYLSLQAQGFREWLFMSQKPAPDFKSNFAGNREVTPEMQNQLKSV
jgi:hypothetical protein